MLRVSGAAVAALACLAVARPAPAQDSRAVGLAIAEACGAVDEAREGVLSGTVRDLRTGVALEGATVMLRWRVAGEPELTSDVTRTDASGMYLFCHASGGVGAELHAELLSKRSDRVTVDIEPGTLTVEHLFVEVSDPDQPGYVVGRVLERATGNAIPAARVSIRGTDVATLTNDFGYFRLDAMPYGVYTLDVEHLAYAAREIPIQVAGALTQNVAIEMSTEALELEGLTVTVEPRRFFGDMDGLVRRMNLGFGDFLTRQDIEKRGSSRLPDLLVGLPGVRVAQNGRSLVIRGRPCTPIVFLDGRPWRLDPVVGLNEIHSFDIEAVEVYKGTAAIPAEFNYSTNGQVGCGALVVWTRRGR